MSLQVLMNQWFKAKVNADISLEFSEYVNIYGSLQDIHDLKVKNDNTKKE